MLGGAVFCPDRAPPDARIAPPARGIWFAPPHVERHPDHARARFGQRRPSRVTRDLYPPHWTVIAAD